MTHSFLIKNPHCSLLNREKFVAERFHYISHAETKFWMLKIWKWFGNSCDTVADNAGHWLLSSSSDDTIIDSFVKGIMWKCSGMALQLILTVLTRAKTDETYRLVCVGVCVCVCVYSRFIFWPRLVFAKSSHVVYIYYWPFCIHLLRT